MVDTSGSGAAAPHADPLAALTELTDVVAADSVDALLGVLLPRLRAAVGADTVRVLLLDPGSDVLRGRAGLGFDDQTLDDVVIPVGEGFAGQIAATRVPLLVEDLDTFEVYAPVLRGAAVRSVAGVPLIAPDSRLLGVLHVGSRVRGRLSRPETVPFLQGIADRIAAALDRAELVVRLQTAERRARVAAAVSAALAEHLQPDAVMQHVAEVVAREMAAVVGVSRLSDVDRTLVGVAVAGVDPAAAETVREALVGLPFAVQGGGLTDRALRTGEPAWVAGGRPLVAAAVHPRLRDAMLAAEVGSAVVVPMHAHGEIVGALSLLRADPAAPDGGTLRFLADLADRAGLVLVNARLLAQLQAERRRFQLMFTSAPIGVVLASLDPEHPGRVIEANPAFAAVTGLHLADLVGRNLSELVHPDDRDVMLAAIAELHDGRRGAYEAERRLLRSDGTTIWVRVSVAVLQGDGVPAFSISYVEDVTQRKAAEAELAHRALHDPLTGLGNRHLAMDHLQLALSGLSRRPGYVGLLYLDLDRFKAVNDTYGHEAGDQVLAEVARRLQVTVRAEDTATRLGGDEFVIVCPTIDSTSGLRALAARVVAAVDAPIRLPAATVSVGASIGVAVSGDSRADPGALMRQADTAMYEAKRRGRHRYQVFSEALGHDAQRRLELEAELRSALAGARLRLHYQPVIDLTDGHVFGAEALLRIDHPERGLLAPGEFIDVAEDSDLIGPLGEWVLGEACRQLAHFDRVSASAGPARLQMAVNVSGRQASDLLVRDAVLRAASDAGIGPERLCLEMTERVLISASDSVVRDLRRLTDAGVRLALDDFGTGYSSLTYLQRLPVSTVKIDRSFVAGVGRRSTDTAIVAAVIALGRTLGLTVVAEGVETDEQLAAVRGMGCGHAQGFRFWRALPPEQFAALLAAAPPE